MTFFDQQRRDPKGSNPMAVSVCIMHLHDMLLAGNEVSGKELCRSLLCVDLLQACLFALQVYASLADAYAAIAERLSGSEGDYFFGSQPSSLDALLFGHLAFHQAAPVSSPEIRHQVRLA